MGKRITSILLCICLALSLLATNALAAAPVDVSTTKLTITKDNQSSYDNAIITGTVSDSAEHLIIDGATVALTIRDLSVVMTGDGLWSAMELKNGATVSLTLEGKNTLTGTYGGAGIAVPAGCSLTVTAASTGSLTATGGDNYGSGAGIGMIGNHYSINASQSRVNQTLGTITIAGGTVVAQGGRNTYCNNRYLGSAGIGGASCGSPTASADAGSISITGGNVTATGGENAAGIGGGSEGYAGSISITGGSVTAIGSEGGAGIGGGRNGIESAESGAELLAETSRSPAAAYTPSAAAVQTPSAMDVMPRKATKSAPAAASAFPRKQLCKPRVEFLPAPFAPARLCRCPLHWRTAASSSSRIRPTR